MSIENYIFISMKNLNIMQDVSLLTDKQRHNRNCIYVDTINGYDIYVLGEKYYYYPENE